MKSHEKKTNALLLHKILIMTDFGIKLQQWYQVNKRALPWRSTNDPYKIWLSEIIMQQTQVVQGERYYLSFINNFKTVSDLAKASEDQVLKLWQGLGYYSRARNLYATANFIHEELNGVFPDTYHDLLKLKGVGVYTASAIASFCYNLPNAVVDGNVYRFISRYKGVYTPIDSTEGKKEFALLADALLDRHNPGLHNQAMMEIGALVCRPSNPVCAECPFINDCYAYAKNDVSSLPVKSKKVKQRSRYFNYFLFVKDEEVWIEKRTEQDIWKNLYQLPLLETKQPLSKEEIKKYQKNKIELFQSCTHVLSHQLINARFFIGGSGSHILNGNEQKVKISDLKNYPFPQLLVNFLKEKIPDWED